MVDAFFGLENLHGGAFPIVLQDFDGIHLAKFRKHGGAEHGVGLGIIDAYHSIRDLHSLGLGFVVTDQQTARLEIDHALIGGAGIDRAEEIGLATFACQELGFYRTFQLF